MPSFRMRLESREKAEWKPPPFRKPLDKSDRKKKFLMRGCLTFLGFTFQLAPICCATYKALSNTSMSILLYDYE